MQQNLKCFLMLSSLELTDISGTSIDAVLHQLFHSCGQPQHHLSRSGLMHRLFVYCLYSSSRTCGDIDVLSCQGSICHIRGFFSPLPACNVDKVLLLF